MQYTDRALVESLLVDANRILLTLGALELRERNPLVAPALRDGLQACTQPRWPQVLAALFR